MLRFLGVAALSVWVGGLTVLGIAAPVLFATLQGHDPIAGRELAGTAFGAVFARFQTAALISGAILLGSFAVRAALGPRPRRLAVRVWTVIAMLAISLATTVAISPRIDRLRTDAHGSIAALPEDDPRRDAFNRLHGLSNGLMLLTVGAGLVLLWFESTDSH